MVAFDTLKLSRKLEGAGFSQEQAGGMAEALADAVDNTVATKADLQATEVSIRADVMASEASLRAELKELGNELRTEIGEIRSDMREMDARTTGRMILLQWMLAVVIAATVIPFIRDFL